MSDPSANASTSFNMYGINVSESGKMIDFSIPFIFMNMIGGGLSYFIAMAWSNVFQSALDEYKKRQEKQGVVTNPVWMNLLLAMVATLFTVSIMYLMIQIYRRIQARQIVQ